MSTRKVIAAALEPLVDALVALEKRLEQMQLAPGLQSPPLCAADPAAVAHAHEVLARACVSGRDTSKERALVATLEPLMGAIVALEKRADRLQPEINRLHARAAALPEELSM